MATPCCPTDVKPAINDYKGVGKKVDLDGLSVYVTGSGENGKAIVLIYDIFGHTPNIEQHADGLAKAGYVVAVPDLIGDAWPPENIPPSKSGKFPEGVEPGDGVDVLYNWIMNHHNCRLDRAESLLAVKDYLVKEYNVTKVGSVGMCWGAKVGFLGTINQDGLFDAVAACHGSFLTKEDAEKLNVPMCLLNSKDEPETYTTEIKPVLESKPFSDKNVFKDFPTMHHGWMGTRGTGDDTDFSNQEIAAKYAEGLSDLINFFNNAM